MSETTDKTVSPDPDDLDDQTPAPAAESIQVETREGVTSIPVNVGIPQRPGERGLSETGTGFWPDGHLQNHIRRGGGVIMSGGGGDGKIITSVHEVPSKQDLRDLASYNSKDTRPRIPGSSPVEHTSNVVVARLREHLLRNGIDPDTGKPFTSSGKAEVS